MGIKGIYVVLNTNMSKFKEHQHSPPDPACSGAPKMQASSRNVKIFHPPLHHTLSCVASEMSLPTWTKIWPTIGWKIKMGTSVVGVDEGDAYVHVSTHR